jgi:hypothetical protein
MSAVFATDTSRSGQYPRHRCGPHADNIGAGGAAASRPIQTAVARISRRRSNHQNQVAALLKDFEIRPVVVHPTKRADLSRHGYTSAQFEDAFARFLPPEPNIRTLKRGGSEKT